MKKLLLIIAVLFIGLSGKIEPRFNLNTVSYYDYQPNRPHQGITLENRTIWEIMTTLNKMTDPSEQLSIHKDKMYWYVYNGKGMFASGKWRRGMKPINFGLSPVMQ